MCNENSHISPKDEDFDYDMWWDAINGMEDSEDEEHE